MKKPYGNIFQDLYAEVKNSKVRTVGELWQIVRSRNPTLTFEGFLNELKTETQRGKLKIEEPSIRYFRDYYKSWRYGLRAWLTALGIIAGLALTEFKFGFPLVSLRWVAGTFLIIIAPGFTFTWALFPSRRGPAGLNRIALTIAMSLFLVPATALALNYTPIGIHAESIAPILAALSLTFLYIGMRREFTVLLEKL